MDRAMKQSNRQFHKMFFSYPKIFSMQCKKNITVEDNYNIINIANFINIYIYRYIYLYYIWREWLKIKMIQWTKYCRMVVLLTKIVAYISYLKSSIFDPVSQTMQMKGSCHLLSYKD